MSGIIAPPTENSGNIIDLGEKMSLFKAGSTYHTDEGPAEHFSLVHCLFHPSFIYIITPFFLLNQFFNDFDTFILYKI